jgi:hypothetical protein
MSDAFYGLNITDVVIGMQGAISVVFYARKSKPIEIVRVVVIGGLSGNYFGSTLCFFLCIARGWPHDLSVYVAGIGGVGLHEIVIRYFSRKKRTTR